MRRQQHFWKGFACGAGTVIGTAFITARLRHGGASRILRLEKSIQIASPIEKVFDAWTNLEQLGHLSNMITGVRSFGNRSRWRLNINGVPVEWEAETTQVIPYEAIGWKSLTGPKHSGRLTFSRIGSDTLVHVQMNYAPPARMLRSLLSPFSGDLEGYIERALRDSKAALENHPAGQRREVHRRVAATQRVGPELLSEKQNTRFAPSPVAAERPPEAKS